jgi:hypothetical protein
MGEDRMEFEDFETGTGNAVKTVRNVLTACSGIVDVEVLLALSDCVPRLCATGERDSPVWATIWSWSELL